MLQIMEAGKEQSEEAAARQAGEPSSSGRQRPEDAVDTKTGPEKSRASSHGEEWRWRIMSLTILPGKLVKLLSECGLKAPFGGSCPLQFCQASISKCSQNVVRSCHMLPT